MGRKRKNGEGTWGTKKIKGVEYRYYRDTSGKYFYGKSDKEINEKRNKHKKNQINDKTLFKDFLKWYYNDVYKDSVEKTTLYTYLRTCDTIINNKYYDIGNIQLKSFSFENNFIREYIQAVTPHYSYNTLKNQIARIKCAVYYAEKNGKIAPGLVDGLKVPKEANVGVKAKTIPFLTKDIIDEMYKHLYDQYNNGHKYKYGYYYWVMMLIIHTGIRSQEARALRMNDVDFKNNTLRIDEAISKIRKKDKTYEYISKVTKNPQSNRIIPLDSIAVEMLHNIIDYTKPKKDNSLICYTKYGYINNNALSKATDRMLRSINASVTHCNPHALRHSFGSILFDQGVDLKTISKLMGHKNIITTANIYIGLTDEKLASSISYLEPQ